jgi:hypothetical protein
MGLKNWEGNCPPFFRKEGVYVKQDRQGVRTASDLERKYQFDKRFAEIMGIALDAQTAVTEQGSELRNEILEQKTAITRDTEKIIMSALESYVETTDLEELKRTLSTEFNVLAEGISGRVTLAEERIKGVDDDLQAKYNTITKYFTFNIDGLTIGAEDNPNKVVIDNDDITIYVSNKEVVTFKADGSGLIPILNVTQQANLVGLSITETATHVNIDYVGVNYGN